MVGAAKLAGAAFVLMFLLSASRTPPSVHLSIVKDSTAEQIQELVAAGFNANVSDEYGWTPLMYAAVYNRDPEVMVVLEEADADVNATTPNGWTALMYAAWRNSNAEVINDLLRLGARASLRNDAGLTALDYVRRNDNLANTNARGRLRNGIAAEEQPCVNINTGNLDELQRITTIGPVMSERFLEQRPFRTLDDLLRVRAVDMARLRAIKAQGVACL
jgi:ankyrin repeat protein